MRLMRRKRRAVMHARTAGAGRIDGVREEVMDIGHIQPQILGGHGQLTVCERPTPTLSK